MGHHKAMHEVSWPGPNGPFWVTLHFEPVEGRMECIGFEIRRQSPDEEPITRVLLQSIPLGRLIDDYRSRHAPQRWDYPSDPDWAAVDKKLWTRHRRKGGRPPKYTAEHWAEVARVYNEAHHSNRTPTRAVAKNFKVSKTAAAKWVTKCRDLGLLLKTTRGKARGADAVARPATVRAVATVPAPAVQARAKSPKPAARKPTKRTRGGSR